MARATAALAHALRAHLLQLANQVERFFSIITSRAIRRGSFCSVKDLISKITKFVDNYNATCQPFAWTATADSILEKLARLCGRINGTGH